jgi:hypothetical protein
VVKLESGSARRGSRNIPQEGTIPLARPFANIFRGRGPFCSPLVFPGLFVPGGVEQDIAVPYNRRTPIWRAAPSLSGVALYRALPRSAAPGDLAVWVE